MPDTACVGLVADSFILWLVGKAATLVDYLCEEEGKEFETEVLGSFSLPYCDHGLIVLRLSVIIS